MKVCSHCGMLINEFGVLINGGIKGICMECGQEAEATLTGSGWRCSCGFAWSVNVDGTIEYSKHHKYGWTVNKVPEGCLLVMISEEL